MAARHDQPPWQTQQALMSRMQAGFTTQWHQTETSLGQTTAWTETRLDHMNTALELQPCILCKAKSTAHTKLRGMLGYGDVVRQGLRGSSAGGRGPGVALQDADNLGAHSNSRHPSLAHRHPAMPHTLSQNNSSLLCTLDDYMSLAVLPFSGHAGNQAQH